MRRIDFQEPDDERWKRWVRRCEARTRRVCNAFENSGSATITQLYGRCKDLFSAEAGAFEGKCGYCERDVLSDYGQLDHYRPKGPPLEQDGSVVGGHPGYYWRWYDWRNLILSCGRCNREKSNFFPLSGLRAWGVAEEDGELPKILNPREDDPDEHFCFCPDTGELKPTSIRGFVTAEILRLNERNLLAKRRNAYRDAAMFYDKTLDDDNPDAQEKIDEFYGARNRDFSSVIRLAIRNQGRFRSRRRGRRRP